MDILLTSIALLLPVLLGTVYLSIFVPAHTAGRTALVWGNGTLLGLLALPQLMRILDAAGAGLTFTSITALVTALIGAALLTRFYIGKADKPPQPTRAGAAGTSGAEKTLFIFLFALIVLRTVNLGMEVFWRPLFPWDATMHWATKARVWFEFNTLVPFVDHEEWLLRPGEGFYTDRHPYYPITVPLLQVWMNLATESWNESLMNLPWVLCFMALGAAFYGQLRHAGVTPLVAISFTYLLLSTPLINIHVALAGYADLFLAAAYCGALMAFYHWSSSRQQWQAALVILFSLSCPLIKNEGAIWPMTFIPALAVMFMPWREAAKLFLLLGLILIFLYLVIPPEVVIAGLSTGMMQPAFHPEALLGIAQSLLLHDNWHLFGFLLLAVIAIVLFIPGATSGAYLPVSTALAAALGLFFYLFLFTGFGEAAMDFTAVGRLSVQLAPGLTFLCALLVNDLLGRDGIRYNPGGEKPAPGSVRP